MMDLLKCSSCSFVYLDLSDEEIEKANASFAADHDSLYSNIQTKVDEFWHEHIVRTLTRKLGKPGNVLDIGCGNGLLLKKFKEHGWHPYGVDLSSWSEQYAERYGFEFFHGKLENSSFARESFDLVVNLSTFEHVTQPVAFVQTLASYLRPGGCGYMAGIPNYGSLAVRLGVSSFHHNGPPKHCNYFSPTSISALQRHIHEQGVTIASQSYGIPELHRFYNWATSAMRNRNPEARRRSPARADRETRNGGRATPLNKAFVLTNYYVGRVGGLGDKLEVYVLRD